MIRLKKNHFRACAIFPVPPNWEWILNGSWKRGDDTLLVAELVRNQKTGIFSLWDGGAYLSVNQGYAAELAANKQRSLT